ncbi:alpha/beta hydrolase [Rubrivirga sp.]|uniref:alpha/beta hydrolase n=1 Tax=Rubrivirga sp. TaxID=1885344 RepID=UPI003C708F31
MLRLAFIASALAFSGCGPAKALLTDVLYDEVALEDALIERDLAYTDGGGDKHRLDLFLPVATASRPWPTVVFVHGGGWTEGDRAQTFGGEDIYGNVGRFFAAHGIGSAVVSYRLMPDATWREQVEDVAAAVAFVQDEVGRRGGDPSSVAVMGHSAGGYLAAFVALDASVLEDAGAEPVCGAAIVSGAALDLADDATWETGTEFDYYARRFSPSRTPIDGPPAEPYGWQIEASPASYATPSAPPFSIVYGDGEEELFQTQANALTRALEAENVPVEVAIMPVFNHEAGVFNLSRDDKVAGSEALRLVDRACRLPSSRTLEG